MRGEDRVLEGLLRVQQGSPPHARGRLAAAGQAVAGIGITPACAGKTANMFGIASLI